MNISGNYFEKLTLVSESAGTLGTLCLAYYYTAKWWSLNLFDF